MDENFSTTPSMPYEKEYSYGYSKGNSIAMILIGAVFTYGSIKLSHSNILLRYLTPFFIMMALFGLWVLITSIWGNLKFILAKDGVYIPSAFNWNKHKFVRFANIDSIALLEISGNIVIQLTVERKKHTIVHTWFPNREDFQEILIAIQDRLPSHLKATYQSS